MRLLAHNDGVELRGNEKQLLLLVTALQRRGHECLVSCRAGGPLSAALQHAGVAVTGIRPRGDLDLLSMHRFSAAVRGFEPDAVLLTSWKRIVNGSYAARAGRAPLPRVVARLGTVRAFPRGWKGLVLRFAFRSRVDRLVVNSQDVAHVWRRTAPWYPRDQLQVIPNAVPAAEPGVSLRRELGLSGRVVLFAGGVEPRKGIDVLLRALRESAELQLLIAGRGPAEGELRRLAQELGVATRVHWLGQRDDIPNLLATSDVFVMPSRQDSLANALLEAMAAGLPVVATSGSGVDEALGPRGERGPAGWIVPPENHVELAAAVRAALADGGMRAAEARWRAQNWFTVEGMADAYERVLFA